MKCSKTSVGKKTSGFARPSRTSLGAGVDAPEESAAGICGKLIARAFDAATRIARARASKRAAMRSSSVQFHGSYGGDCADAARESSAKPKVTYARLAIRNP